MLIDIEKIKVQDRIRKDFGNLHELAEDIKENGLINPPVITPDTYELIAGERRLRAMKLLGYQQIEVRPMSVKDAEHQLNLEISENETRKDFSKAERIDYAKRLRAIEELKAKDRQGERNDIVENFPPSSDRGKVRDIVADKLNIGSGRQLEKEEFIVANQSSLSSEEFAEWDEGKLSTNKAFLKIKEQLAEKDKTISEYQEKQKQYDEQTEKANELQEEIDKLKKELDERPEVEKEVVPIDYEYTKEMLKGMENDYCDLETQYNEKVDELTKLKDQIRAIKEAEPAEQYSKKLKDTAIFFCARVNDFIEKTGGMVWLADHINELPDYERKSYLKAVDMIDGWAQNLRANLDTTLKLN